MRAFRVSSTSPVILAVASAFLAGSKCEIGTASSPEVAEASIIGVTPHVDFEQTGLVDLSILPKDATGETLIDDDVLVDVTVSEPADIDLVQQGRVNNQPNPNARLAAAIDVDSSGSMSDNDPNGLRKAAAKSFVDELGVDDELAIFDFGAGGTFPTFSDTRVLLEFTADKAAAKQAIDLVTESDQGTPLFSSVIEVLDYVNKKRPAGAYNRALTVLGDGEDNEGDYSDEACAKAVETGIPINTIGLGPAADQNPKASAEAVEVLQKLASCSGGAYTGVVDASGLQSAFTNFGTSARSGSIVVTVRFDPVVQSGQTVSGQVNVSTGEQEPVTVTYSFVAP